MFCLNFLFQWDGALPNYFLAHLSKGQEKEVFTRFKCKKFVEINSGKVFVWRQKDSKCCFAIKRGRKMNNFYLLLRF